MFSFGNEKCISDCDCAFFEINRQIDKIAVEKPNLFSTIYLFNISMSEPRAPAKK